MGLAQVKVSIDTAEVFEPLLQPARYKGAYGGRGSGKSHFFAEMLIDDSVRMPGLRSVCIREVQKSLKESAKRLIEDKIESLKVGSLFDVQESRIVTPGGGAIIFQGMQDHTAESIKSLEGFDRAWVEEAQSLSARSLQLLRPTIRGDESELWFSWNPRLKTDPVDRMFRGGSPPTNSVCVRANWSDNPWFPGVLNQERLDCLTHDSDQYAHVWDGDYITVQAGAYYAKHLAEARAEGRIGRVTRDPLQTIRLYWDIGGSGARADACAIWVVQFVGQEIRWLDYYEAQGQPLESHVAWLRTRGYDPNRAQVWLPHDGAQQDKVFAVSYESALRGLGYRVTVVPNQGKGAAKARIEALRLRFAQSRFNAETCEAGLEALGWYHEKIDEQRGIGLGPEHDWASHCCDAAGLVAVTYQPPSGKINRIKYAIQRPTDRAMGY